MEQRTVEQIQLETIQELKAKMDALKPSGTVSTAEPNADTNTDTNTDNSKPKKQYSEMEDNGLVLLLSKNKVPKERWQNATREERIAILQEVSPR